MIRERKGIFRKRQDKAESPLALQSHSQLSVGAEVPLQRYLGGDAPREHCRFGRDAGGDGFNAGTFDAGTEEVTASGRRQRRGSRRSSTGAESRARGAPALDFAAPQPPPAAGTRTRRPHRATEVGSHQPDLTEPLLDGKPQPHHGRNTSYLPLRSFLSFILQSCSNVFYTRDLALKEKSPKSSALPTAPPGWGQLLVPSIFLEGKAS